MREDMREKVILAIISFTCGFLVFMFLFNVNNKSMTYKSPIYTYDDYYDDFTEMDVICDYMDRDRELIMYNDLTIVTGTNLKSAIQDYEARYTFLVGDIAYDNSIDKPMIELYDSGGNFICNALNYGIKLSYNSLKQNDKMRFVIEKVDVQNTNDETEVVVDKDYYFNTIKPGDRYRSYLITDDDFKVYGVVL